MENKKRENYHFFISSGSLGNNLKATFFSHFSPTLCIVRQTLPTEKNSIFLSKVFVIFRIRRRFLSKEKKCGGKKRKKRFFLVRKVFFFFRAHFYFFRIPSPSDEMVSLSIFYIPENPSLPFFPVLEFLLKLDNCLGLS